ncbi:ankyrin repeat domain-containing protein 6 [Chanos chanos]|uniref:Ankyrin repeat domain-containing protein 6 n=1 Tax=Chanos chanos TaxID=29144 RepID=A0A6J2WN60_CHACN|nr:ankyrin repeat domain-containing protein 6-like [Chanos chanos]
MHQRIVQLSICVVVHTAGVFGVNIWDRDTKPSCNVIFYSNLAEPGQTKSSALCLTRGDNEVAHSLLNTDYNLCTLYHSHQTALHRAAVVGNRDAIAALVQGGCALDLQDKDGNTALHEVSWHGFGQCVKLLVKAGANVHVKNKAGNTALHLACQNGHSQSARVLLLGGSTPDSKNNAGDTCLHTAARYSHLAMIKILLGTFCSVAEKNQAGDTALHIAAALNHKKTVNLLLEGGADSNIRNNAGKTPLDQARDHNNRDLAILLAKSNQVQRFARGRTVRKRRDLQRAERRAHSVPREEVLPGKDSASVAEDTHSSDLTVHKTGTHHIKPSSSPRTRHRIKNLKERHVSKREDYLHKHRRERPRSCSPLDDEDSPNRKAYQLYTLYRDKDGEIRQAPANSCHCKPLIKKLESQLKATKEEMKAQIHSIQEEMNCKLGRIDRKSKYQIKVLEKMTQERVSAERMECRYRIDQRATMERVEDDKRQQGAIANDLKSWCVSKIQDVQVHVPAEAPYYKLLKSPSANGSLLENDLESLPLLSVISEESTSSLATYVNVLPSPESEPLSNEKNDENDVLGRRYLEIKMDPSADNYQNTSQLYSTFSASGHNREAIAGSLASAGPKWLHSELQDAELSEGRRGTGEALYSSASSSLSAISRGLDDSDVEPGKGQAYSHHAHHLRDTIKVRANAQHGGTVSTLEFFAERPSEPSFLQERANLHAMEVTQRFFETVSTQLERWYVRKIQEAQRVAELKGQQEKATLIERINNLEEELQMLRANTSTEQPEQPRTLT